VAQRNIAVQLSATVDDYKQAMREAAAATLEVGSAGEKLAQTRQSMVTLGAAGVAMGAAIAAGVGVAVAKFAEFDQAMSFVAATGDDARENMDALRQAALEAGSATVFSATESANAIEEMAKAGLSARDILAGGLTGALDLAAAGGLGVAEAAGIAATTLQQFQLDGEEATHVADLLAAGAGKAMGDVTDLGTALDQAGLVASQFGLSVDETVGTLSAFASAGMLGSDAGTSMRTMLLRLANPTKEVADLMSSLGISAYDTQGNFVGLSGLAGELETGLEGMTQAQRDQTLAMIFGQDAIRGANILLREGTEGIDEWTEKVADQGYAADTAATRLDNLMGDWEALTGAMDTAFISMGEGANGPLRDIIQGLTELVDGFNGLPDWAQQSALGIAVLTAGIGLVGGAALLTIPKIVEFQIAMSTLGITAGATRAGLSRIVTFLTGPWGIALVAAASAIVGLQMAQDALTTSTEEFQNVIQNAKSPADLFDATVGVEMTSRLDEATSSVKVFKENLDIIKNNDFLRGLRGDVSELKGSLGEIGGELAKTATTDLPAAQRAFRMLGEEYELNAEELGWLLDTMPEFKKSLQDQATELGINVTTLGEAENAQALLNFAMGESEGTSKTATQAYMEEADAVQDLHAQLMDLIDAVDKANGLNRDAVSANIDYQDTLRAVDEQIRNINDGVEGYAKGLDIATESGAANMEMLVGMSQDAWDAAAAQLELDGNTATFTETLEAQRQKLYDAAIQMGASDEEAAQLRDTLLGMPDAKTIQVLAETSAAQSKVSALWNSLNDLAGRTWNIPVATTTVGQGTVLKPDGNANGGIYENGVKSFAAGGVEPGIYPYTNGGIQKFAEEYDEAFISMDPRRRDRSYGVWMEAGDRFGFQQQQAQAQQRPINVNQKIYAQPGMNESQVATKSAAGINRALRG